MLSSSRIGGGSISYRNGNNGFRCVLSELEMTMQDHAAPSPTVVELLTLSVGSIVNSVAFSPDGTRNVTGSYDATARVRDAQNGKEQHTLAAVSVLNSIACSQQAAPVVQSRCHPAL